MQEFRDATGGNLHERASPRARVNVYVHVSARMCAVHACVKLVMGPGR